mgnify:CR=1 FL=1
MKRVLVIEDNENNMELISFILESHDCQVLKAVTGRDGYEQTVRERPDFVILDIQLPDIMGTEVLKMIRASPVGASIPVIAMTSYAMAGDEQRLVSAGCSGYIEKPIDPQRVMDQINRILGDRS